MASRHVASSVMGTSAKSPPSLLTPTAPLASVARASTQEVEADDLDLGSLYEEQRAWPELVEHSLARAEETPDPAQRARLLSKAASVFERFLSDPEGAFLTYTAAVKACADHEGIGALERLAFELNRGDALPETFRQAATTAPSASAAAAAWTALARWQRSHASWDACAKAAQNALACVPRDLIALAELEAAERHLERWGDLARTLHRRLAHLAQQEGWDHDPGQRAAAASLWADLAAIYEERLLDFEQALAACHRAVEIDSARASVWARMERLCEATGRDELVVVVLQWKLAQTPPGQEHTQLALKLAGKWQSLSRLDEATSVIEGALENAPHAQALYEELAQLYSARGCWNQFIDNCWQHASIASDQHVRSRLAFEAGRVLQNRLARNDAAAAAYTEALAHEPHHLNARRGLVSIYRSRGDVESLAESLWELAELSDDRSEQVASFTEAASILRDNLRDTARARLIEARLLTVDPGNEATLARRLAEARKAQRWQAVIDLLAETSRTRRPNGTFVAYAAEAHFRLGNIAEALAAFKHADELAAKGNEWRVFWVMALGAAGHHQQAAAVGRELLVQPGLSAWHLCELQVAMGHTFLATRNTGAACSAFAAALEALPGHVPAMSALAQAYFNQKNLPEAVAWKWSAFDRAETELDKVNHALEIFGWVRHAANDANGARTVLEHAISHVPTSSALLHALLDLHTSQGQWLQANAVLSRLASGAQDQTRAKYLLTAGKIAQHHLGDLPAALAMFEAALDAHPNEPQLALRIERLFLESNDARGCERHLRRQLSHMTATDPGPEEEAQLWEKLVRLYQGPLRDSGSAAVALEVLACLRQNPASLERLAAAYEQGGLGATQRAVHIHVHLLSQAPDVPALARPLRELARVFARTGDLTRSLNVATGLVLVGHATQAEQELVMRAADGTFIPPAATLRDSAWSKHIYHPEQNQAVSAVFAHVASAVMAAHARTAKEWGFAPRWNATPDPELECHPFVLRFRHLAAVLGVTVPPLVPKPDFEGVADLVVVGKPDANHTALAIGKGFFEPRTDVEFAFVMGRVLTRLRQENLLTWPNLVSSCGELRAIVAAACRLAGVAIELPADYEPLVRNYFQHFVTQLSPASSESLAIAAASLPPRGDVTMLWLRGMAFTANRAGLLMSRDLTSAVQLAPTDRLLGIGLNRFEALRDLLSWSATTQYAMFVRHLTPSSELYELRY